MPRHGLPGKLAADLRRIFRQHGKATVAAAGVAVVLVGCGSRGGPLQPPQVVSTIGFHRVVPHRPFAFGGVFVRNTSGDRAILDAVALISPSHGLAIVGRYVVLERESQLWAASNSFPLPRVRLHPFLHAVVPAHGEVQVMLALVVSAPGRFTAQGVTLDYHIGGRHYRALFPVRLVAAPVR